MFKDKLAELLEKNKKNGISGKTLGDYLGISKAAVSNWKKGKSSPPPEMVEKIAKYFNVTTDYLLKTDEAPNDNNQNFGNHNTIITGSDNQLSNFNNSNSGQNNSPTSLTPEESEFIKIYRSLDGSNRLKLLAFISSLGNEKQ
jgi:transcriptional regulator with XRE-family HTH domain